LPKHQIHLPFLKVTLKLEFSSCLMVEFPPPKKKQKLLLCYCFTDLALNKWYYIIMLQCNQLLQEWGVFSRSNSINWCPSIVTTSESEDFKGQIFMFS
jgi:hypothetical protein